MKYQVCQVAYVNVDNFYKTQVSTKKLNSNVSFLSFFNMSGKNYEILKNKCTDGFTKETEQDFMVASLLLQFCENRMSDFIVMANIPSQPIRCQVPLT